MVDVVGTVSQVEPGQRALRALLLFTSLAGGGCDAEGQGDLPDLRLGPTVEGYCAQGAAGEDSDLFADCVEAFEPRGGVAFGHDRMPKVVLGPPKGGGLTAGGTDVASLGCGGSIVLFFDAPGIVDGPGPDLVVFENAFVTTTGAFLEPARVEVSDDGENWAVFPCEAKGDLSGEDALPRGCAGVSPVLMGASPLEMGGDRFDLAAVGLEHARYVRIVDVAEELGQDPMWCAGKAGGFDLDAVAAVHGS